MMLFSPNKCKFIPKNVDLCFVFDDVIDVTEKRKIPCVEFAVFAAMRTARATLSATTKLETPPIIISEPSIAVSIS